MSNARSPRDVCSTTIGTSGLTVLASFRLSGANPAYERLRRAHPLDRGESSNGPRPPNPVGRLASGRPEPARTGLFRLIGARGPELVARLRLLDRDRGGGLRDAVDRLALGELGLEAVDPAAGAQALEQLLRRGAVGGGSALERLEHLLVARLDALGLDDGGEHGLATYVAPGRLAVLGDDLVLVLAGDLEVRLARDALVGERVDHLLPPLARARFDERVGDVDRGGGNGGVDRGLAELGVDLGGLRLRQALANVRAQLVERVEAGLGGEVVVEGRQLLGLDLLDRDGELGLPAGQLGRAVVIGEGDRDGALVAGRRARELVLEAGHEAARAELDHLVAPLAAGEGLALERAEVVHDHEVARGGGAVRRLELGAALAQRLDLGVDRLVGDGW